MKHLNEPERTVLANIIEAEKWLTKGLLRKRKITITGDDLTVVRHLLATISVLREKCVKYEKALTRIAIENADDDHNNFGSLWAEAKFYVDTAREALEDKD